jgi:4'-phosphopantetheinyl transferase
LNDEERARVERFKFERHRRESLATRALVRTALSRSHPTLPRDWRFKSNPQGKPETDPECGLSFNLSNSLGLVVCLVAEGTRAAVGVDVEPYERGKQIVELAPKVFSPAEQAQLKALPEAQKPDRALSLWTLKESYIKARGLGLQIPLDKFSFVFGETEGIRLEIDASLGDDALWQFCQLDHAGHRIAEMVEGMAMRELEVWEARPPFAEPVRVGASAVKWFSRA